MTVLRMHKAKLFKKLAGKRVQCTACQRYCQIEEGRVGFCLSRKNIDGQLYSLNYGFSSGIQIDPIEKKPLYHFYPGSQVLSIGSWGCNYRCKQCQNWHCSWGDLATSKLKAFDPSSGRGSQSSKLDKNNENKEYISPEDLVNLAVKNHSPGIAFTYNEPVIWSEYVYDTSKLAKERDLYTIFVSNGSWSEEALAFYGPVLDAANIDFKGWGEKVYAVQGAFWGKLLDNLSLAFKKYKIHLELTTLVIPGINDNPRDLKQIASFIVKNLGPQIPWHLSRFSPAAAPDREFAKIPPTSAKTLKQAYEIGKEAGLYFVYVWAPPTRWNEELFSIGETSCPKCSKLVVKRSSWQPELVGVKKDKKVKKVKKGGVCQFCGADLYLKS